MKKIWFLLLGICIVNTTKAQVDDTIFPKSFSATRSKIITEYLLIDSISTKTLAELDKADEVAGRLPKFSRSVSTDFDIKQNGILTTFSNGDKVWTLTIKSHGAKALIPFFDKFYLPQGSTLHLYSKDKKQIIGAYTFKNNNYSGHFCGGIIIGDEVTLEYFEPKSVSNKGNLHINEVGYAYRWIDGNENTERDFGGSGSCQVNVNCTEGNNFQDQKNAVVRILVQSNSGQGWCSGALINNAKNDCTPYLLSAQHCSEGTSTAQYNQYVFYFNYEAASCSNPTSQGTLANKFINGCTKKADSNDNGGASGSDFILLELNAAPNASWSPFYAGWNISTTGASSGAGIHHPDGDIKKISTFTQAATSTSWGSASGSHWRIFWSATTNGHGVTEGGSSGSPIFNNNGEIVGTLTGGDSYCNAPTQADKYGKFSYHWTSNGNTATRQLKPWLDPENTGITSLSGVYSPCAATISNDAGIQSILEPSGTVCGTTISPVVQLRNFGNNTLTAVTINYTINGIIYTYDWNGSLNSFNTTTVHLPSVTEQAGNHTLIVATSQPNNTLDLNLTNDTKSTTFTLTGVASSLNLHLETDEYGSETSWEIVDYNNATLYSGGPFSDNNNGQVINTPICLEDGCYTLYLYDSYGDGMNGNLTGQMTLSDINTGIVHAMLNNPGFGYETSFYFCSQVSSVNPLENFSYNIYPNPSNGKFLVTTTNSNSLTISVCNAIGQQLFQSTIHDTLYALDLTAYPKGIYYVQFLQNGFNVIKKIIIQ